MTVDRRISKEQSKKVLPVVLVSSSLSRTCIINLETFTDARSNLKKKNTTMAKMRNAKRSLSLASLKTCTPNKWPWQLKKKAPIFFDGVGGSPWLTAIKFQIPRVMAVAVGTSKSILREVRVWETVSLNVGIPFEYLGAFIHDRSNCEIKTPKNKKHGLGG